MVYPEPSQKSTQSLYKPTLDNVDFDLWINDIFPTFETLTADCHCQKELQNETHRQGHLASGNLDQIIQDPIIRNRLKRGPMFRETTDGDLPLTRQALDYSLRDFFDRKRLAQAQPWIK